MPALDSQILYILGNIAELWNYRMGINWIMVPQRSCPTQKWPNFDTQFGEDLLAVHTFNVFETRYGRPFDRQAYAYNNAVALLNLRKWRQEDKYLQTEYAFWIGMAEQFKNTPGNNWWYTICQSMMWFAYQANVTVLPLKDWHCGDLGWKMRERVSLAQAKRAKVLHWNGREKPWMNKIGPFYELWKKHAPTECNDIGRCTAVKKANTNSTLSYRCVT